ncbi:DUF2158 domain-containing protein [Paenalcaligenes niemegkensis]|uniref:YodC family protein n=1 Tax=Paenalcaligenes niemegkensis TaxID=2895469 RepID=UPI001EE80B70|nr:DUF2158 domain-containing protein [Paenalcaligenes niemegkensis]MCQ9616373.1 DUF2158 domain-containing protein [Paenalcaligenes niemegkensis]
MSFTKMFIGDVVRLKSGGPQMTVTQLGLTHGRVECSWFVNDVEIRSAFIHSDAIVRVDESLNAASHP